MRPLTRRDLLQLGAAAAGIFASLLGGPYLIYLLGKGVQRHG